MVEVYYNPPYTNGGIEKASANLKLSIGSSSKNTKSILERIGPGDFFDAIADGADITHSKPDPD